MSDDYTANTRTTGTVTVGGSATGDIESAGDRDWFAVTLEANKTYRIDLEGSRTGAGDLDDPYLRGVYDADGGFIGGTWNDDGGTGLNSRVAFTPTADGTYYVAAGAYGSSQGTYKLSVTEIPDDFVAGTGTTGTVAVGGSATGDIQFPGDRDWFAVTLEANTTYRIDLEGSPTGAGTLRDPYLRGVYDADGGFIGGTWNDDGGTGLNSRVAFTPTADGTYYVAAGDYGSSHYGSSQGTYKLSVTEITDDFAAGTGTTGTVAVGGSATGDIQFPGDRDWFAVALDANKTYRIDLEGSPTGDGTLRDPYLRGVYDADGVLIGGTGNNDGGSGYNSRMAFTPTADGTYYVAAGADGNRQGTYKLSVTEIPDDFAAGTGTTGTVAVGGSATGDIESAGDRDWFAVTLDANKTYRIDLEGSRTGAGTLDDPYLRGVYDDNGVLIGGTSNDDGGTGLNSRMAFTPTADGTYYVAAGVYGSSQGTYTLSVTEVTNSVTDDFAAGTGTTGTVAVGGSATGDIESAGDRDWFAVTLDANKTYRIDLEGSPTGAGDLDDPYLRGVYDDNGGFIGGTSNDDGGTGLNSRVAFTPTADGTYYVAAGVYGSSQGTYTLSVTEVTNSVTDDFAAGTGTTGTVAVGGSATGDIESAGDRDWFAVMLEAGTTYRIDLEGSRTGAGTLRDPYLRGVYDDNGVYIGGTSNDDGGTGLNSRVEAFTPSETGTYYVAAGAYGSREGTYTLSVEEVI